MFMELILFARQVAKRFLCSVAAGFFQPQAESFYNPARGTAKARNGNAANSVFHRSPNGLKKSLTALPIGAGKIRHRRILETFVARRAPIVTPFQATP
jgi:hypothetical protein